LNWLPLQPALHRVDNDPCPEAQDHDASDHLTDDQHPSRLRHGRNITEPAVANTVTVKYNASVRVIGWLKLPAEMLPMTK
jgi:hypothetical protein